MTAQETAKSLVLLQLVAYTVAVVEKAVDERVHECLRGFLVHR